MTFTPSREQLRGLSVEVASLYGMPHIGCRYTAEDIAATAFSDAMPQRRCACCGRTDGPHNRHHEPPRSKGSFLMQTPRGRFVLLPALIDLCGSGTQGCHGARHSGLLRIEWKWNSDEEAAMWWDGTFLSWGLRTHGPWLWEHGRYVFCYNGVAWEHRGEI